MLLSGDGEGSLKIFNELLETIPAVEESIIINIKKLRDKSIKSCKDADKKQRKAFSGIFEKAAASAEDL